MLAVVLVILTALFAAVLYSRGKAKNGPPGPRALPLIGNTFDMEMIRKERSLLKWRQKHGPIFQCSFLGRTIVVLSDPELIRETLSLTATANRETNSIMPLFYADMGIIFSSGDTWRETRRFTLHHLRNFGMGGSQLEPVIQDHVQAFLEGVLAPAEGRPLRVDQGLRVVIANIIWGLVSSERFDIGDTRALAIMASFEEIGQHVVLLSCLFLFPWLQKLPWRLTGMDQLMKLFYLQVDSLLQPAIDEHARTVDLAAPPRDYIDCMLQEQARRPNLFTNRHMVRCILDLFVAGYDTTTSTLLWAFCFLCQNGEVQRRVREEIACVADGRAPTLADRPRMPYTEAFLMETQRAASIAPMAIEHLTSADVEVGGYTIPRGAQVISLLQAVHQDPALFPEPDRFRPERFLDADGKVKPNRALMPFGSGKRSCIGEALARAELFLFVTSVLHRYTMRFPDGFQHDLSCSETKQLIREPTPFEIILERSK